MLTQIILLIILIIILLKNLLKNINFKPTQNKRILPKDVEKTKKDFNKLLTFEELLEDEED